MPTISDIEYFINKVRIKLTTCTLLIIREHNESTMRHDIIIITKPFTMQYVTSATNKHHFVENMWFVEY